MVYTSIGISADVSVEAFYQLEWEKTRSDPCGTFFSTVDFVADGCGPVVLGGTIDERLMLEARDVEIASGVPLSNRAAPMTERLSDDEAKDDGQYGIAARWYSEALGDTEFGIYYMNIHSRLPFINGSVTNQDRNGVLGNGDDRSVNDNATYDSYRPLYQIAYPEDNQLMGISFATSTEDGASISGEISYRPDAPIQWNAFELILAGNGAPWSRLYQARAAEVGGDATSLYGELAEGYDEMDIWQAQMTFIKFYDQVFGADRLSVVAEVGATYIPDLPDLDEARYGRSGVFGIGNNDGVWDAAPTTNFCVDGGDAANVNTDYCTDEGYVTQLSGGVRLRASMDYNNAFSGINVSPNFAVSYDKGNGPEPGAQFIDERLTTAVGVKFVYQNRTQVSMNYTQFDGGEYNTTKDRDNIALSASYSF